MHYEFQKLASVTAERQSIGLKLHCGYKETNRSGTKFPKAVDYFIADGHFKERFDQVIGKTDRLKISFPIPDQDPSKICKVVQEGLNPAGVPLGWIHIDYWNDPDSVKYEIFSPKQQRKIFVEEADFHSHREHYKVEYHTTLQLFFMLEDFIRIGIETYARLDTKGIESSIPDILTVIKKKAERGRLWQPFELFVKINEGRGIKEDGETQVKKYAVLSLAEISTQEAIDSQTEAFKNFYALRSISFFDRALQITGAPEQKQLTGAPEGSGPRYSEITVQRCESIVARLKGSQEEEAGQAIDDYYNDKKAGFTDKSPDEWGNLLSALEKRLLSGGETV
jgi:hypothetical protein